MSLNKLYVYVCYHFRQNLDMSSFSVVIYNSNQINLIQKPHKSAMSTFPIIPYRLRLYRLSTQPLLTRIGILSS